jgi:hypothetical protein
MHMLACPAHAVFMADWSNTERETQSSPTQDLCFTTALSGVVDATIFATCAECKHASFEDPESLIKHVQTHVEQRKTVERPVLIDRSVAYILYALPLMRIRHD